MHWWSSLSCTTQQETSFISPHFNLCVFSTEELIDTGLSVLSLESRDTCSTDTTNTDKVSGALRNWFGVKEEISHEHNTGLTWNKGDLCSSHQLQGDSLIDTVAVFAMAAVSFQSSPVSGGDGVSAQSLFADRIRRASQWIVRTQQLSCCKTFACPSIVVFFPGPLRCTAGELLLADRNLRANPS